MTELLEVVDLRGLRVDGTRLLSRIERLRAIGATPEGGVQRVAFSAEDVAGRELTASFMAEAGLEVRVDPAGNLIGTRSGRSVDAPVLLMGSHIDTVPNGGALDGAYGVLGAIEVMHTIDDHGLRLHHPAAVVAFTNEEGALGTRGMWGSHAFVGGLLPADLAARDDNGTPVAELLAAVGGDVRRVAVAAWRPEQVAAYLELHVEQGPVLEHRGFQIGVVEAITGRLTVHLVVRGESNHAGTTPMELRKDALVAAARLILAIHGLGGDGGVVRVATVGYCSVEPNAWNVVPAVVTLRVDLRDVRREAIAAALTELRVIAARVALATDTAIEVSPEQVVEPVACARPLRELIEAAANRVGVSWLALPSGAGHDAQVIGAIAPIGMIFVPSRGGKSHVPAEATEPDHLVAGADVLLQTALDCDRTTG
jgi:N-carbamoyl-L-amino-acid hydrolase